MKRRYGFYVKVENRWTRIGEQDFPKDIACQIFQDLLIGLLRHNASLRPVKEGERQAILIVGPAYGRVYNTADEAITDWNANKDFTNCWRFVRGQYVNKAQIPNKHVLIVYRKDELVFV